MIIRADKEGLQIIRQLIDTAIAAGKFGGLDAINAIAGAITEIQEVDKGQMEVTEEEEDGN